jgi:hypothetical protein
MKRFMGMMPSNEVEIIKSIKDKDGKEITIESGKNGWTILYADSSSHYQDVESTAEENFNRALEILKSHGLI